jgi:hypothetical protein
MRTTLIALSVGITMLNGAGGVLADTVAPVEARTAADTQKKATAAAQNELHGPMLLTETQMDDITAGHLTVPTPVSSHFLSRHYGLYIAGYKLVNGKEIRIVRTGWHVGTGD